MKTRISELLQDLATAARDQKIYNAEICRRAGLHENTLRHFPGYMCRPARGRWQPTVRVLERLEQVLFQGKTLRKPRAKKPAE